MTMIQGLWIGPSLSTMERMCINSFIKNGFEFVLYTYAPIENTPYNATLRDANDILPETMIPHFNYRGRPNNGVAFSDVFRFKLLHDRGGIWVDLDVACLRPFRLTHEYCFQTWPGTEAVGTCFLAAPRGSQLMQACYSQALEYADQLPEWGTLGFDLLARLLKEHGLTRFARQLPFLPIHWKDTGILREDSLRARLLWARFGRQSTFVHFHNEMWRIHNINKDSAFPRYSIYERLKRRYG
jgi:hypothetical protein